MATIYQTPWGPSWDPMPVHMWTWGGESLGRVAEVEKASAMWSTAEADLLEVTAGLVADNAPMLATDGTTLLSVTLGGMTLLAQPAQVTLAARGDTPEHGVIRVAASGGRALLEGQTIIPDPDMPLGAQTGEEITLRGPVETVVKRVLTWGAELTGHPVAVMPDQGRGPFVSVTGAMSSAAELVDAALAGSGWWLDMPGWVPGQAQPEGMTLDRPTYLADVRPYRDRPGLMWSVAGGDLDGWEVEMTRATATRALVGEELEGAYRYLEVAGQEGISPWSRRDIYVAARDGDDLEAAGRAELAGHVATASADMPLTPGAQWRLGDDQGPGAYRHGDLVTVVVPVLGEITQTIAEVRAELDRDRFTITPTVSPPDSVSHDIYAAVSAVGRRVARLERKR